MIRSWAVGGFWSWGGGWGRGNNYVLVFVCVFGDERRGRIM